jgi:hypothetical protein
MCGRGRIALCAGLVVLSTPATRSTAGPDEAAPLRSNLEREGERKALARALAGAARRLEQPACRRIFADFADPSGQPLQAVLDASGRDAAGFLRDWVYFADGREHARCAEQGVLAVTAPGSRAVWICGRRFQWEQWRDPAYMEVVLIHETLHVLGLGENPPTSAAISRQVLARCGG